VPAPELGVEEVQGLPHRQRRIRLDRVVEASAAGLCAVGQSGHSGGEVLVDLFGHLQRTPSALAAGRTRPSIPRSSHGEAVLPLVRCELVSRRGLGGAP